MHFVIGGAYNGKRQWVRAELEKHAGEDRAILEINTLIPEKELSPYKAVIWSDIEHWIEANWYNGMEEEQLLKRWRNAIDELIQWEEKDEAHQVVIIGTDQSKGIVPLDQTKRAVRDLAGWCHQYTAKKAERVTRVWYGIAEKLK